MTNREAIYRVKRLFREVNADSRFSNKLAYTLLRSTSKLLIYRESERLKLSKKSNIYKILKCVNVIEAPAIDTCCGISSMCKVWRTEEKLPEIYEDSYGPIIREVTTIDNGQSISITNATTFRSKLKNPWLSPKKKQDKFTYYSDGYLYFPLGGFRKINIEAFFEEEPKSLCEDGDNEDCTRFLDKSFTIPDYLEKSLFDMVEQEISATYRPVPEKSHQIDKNDQTAKVNS